MTEETKNEPVKVYNPDGSFLCETDDEYIFESIKKRIAKYQYEGYTIVFKGLEYKINKYGRVENCNEKLFPNEGLVKKYNRNDNRRNRSVQ